MHNFRPTLSTEIVQGLVETPPVDLAHVTWGDIFMQNRNGGYDISPHTAIAMLHETYLANRAQGLSHKQAMAAERGGYFSAKTVPILIEDERMGFNL